MSVSVGLDAVAAAAGAVVPTAALSLFVGSWLLRWLGVVNLALALWVAVTSALVPTGGGAAGWLAVLGGTFWLSGQTQWRIERGYWRAGTARALAAGLAGAVLVVRGSTARRLQRSASQPK
ncbi:MAG TPA: hypothetical protein VES95_07070 [Dermatophilaceae bacterium]|nr:hypothetical protein [Dermatophilaceae bacterium]